jgi:hypothetical protein
MTRQDEPTLEGEPLWRLAEKAMQQAVKGVIEEARRTNGVLVVWENGAVRHISAAELPPTDQAESSPTDQIDSDDCRTSPSPPAPHPQPLSHRERGA